MVKIIGLIGTIGSGKTTAAKFFIENGYVEYAFAEPIKKIGEIFGFSKEQLNGTQEQKLEINKHWGISGRTFMQIFGTEVCKTDLPTRIPEMTDVWCQLFRVFVEKRSLLNDSSRELRIVVSDVRFQNEANIIREMGGKLIRIHRKSNLFSSSHISETELSTITPDVVIDNTDSIEKLYDRLREFTSSMDL